MFSVCHENWHREAFEGEKFDEKDRFQKKITPMGQKGGQMSFLGV